MPRRLLWPQECKSLSRLLSSMEESARSSVAIAYRCSPWPSGSAQGRWVTSLPSACSLLNANKINCLRVNTFQDLQNLNLLSLYDNKLQTISKGLFAPLQAIQTL